MPPNAVSPPSSVPLNLLDELYLGFDRPAAPWGVHFEVHVTGRVDAARLVGAIGEATRRHPIARASLAAWRPTDLGYRWEIADAVRNVALTTVAAADDPALAAAREELFAVSPSLVAAPPFAVVLAHGPAGDSIMLNLHHGAGDGVSAARLMRSVLLAYAGEDDPAPETDGLAARDLRALVGAASAGDRVARAGALARHAARRVGPPTRIATSGSDGRAGYGFELMPFSAADSAAVFARRADGATVNDVLLAALAVTIRRWNEDRGRPSHRIALSMPIDVRPPPWRGEVVGNFATFVTVLLAARDSTSVADALPVTTALTRRIKRDGLAGIVVDLLAAADMVPVGAKRLLPELIAMTGDRAVDTATLSNLGVLDGLPALGGDAGGIDAVWFSPPSRMPLGTALGVATLDGRLHIALRHRHPQFDGAGARAFAHLYRQVLLGRTPGPGHTPLRAEAVLLALRRRDRAVAAAVPGYRAGRRARAVREPTTSVGGKRIIGG